MSNSKNSKINNCNFNNIYDETNINSYCLDKYLNETTCTCKFCINGNKPAINNYKPVLKRIKFCETDIILLNELKPMLGNITLIEAIRYSIHYTHFSVSLNANLINDFPLDPIDSLDEVRK
jgi:hypothetical protein